MFWELLLLSTANVRTTITCWLIGSMLFGVINKVLKLRMLGSSVCTCWLIGSMLFGVKGFEIKDVGVVGLYMLAHWLDVVWG